METETSKLESIERILFLNFQRKATLFTKSRRAHCNMSECVWKVLHSAFDSTLALWILNNSPLFCLFPWLNNKCRICDLVRHCLQYGVQSANCCRGVSLLTQKPIHQKDDIQRPALKLNTSSWDLFKPSFPFCRWYGFLYIGSCPLVGWWELSLTGVWENSMLLTWPLRGN